MNDENTPLAHDLPAETFLAAEDGVGLTVVTRLSRHAWTTTLQAKEFIQKLFSVRKPFLYLRLRARGKT